MGDWKPAKKAYTKAQKRRRAEIREEFEWTLETPLKRPHLLVFGEWKWLESLIRLNNEYKEASEGRDELMNNIMFLFAFFKPELFAKTSKFPQSLGEEERHQAEVLLRAALKETELDFAHS